MDLGTIIDFRLNITSKLVSKGHDLEDLNELSLKELRNLYDQEFPRQLVIRTATASGGTSVKVINLTKRSA